MEGTIITADITTMVHNHHDHHHHHGGGWGWGGGSWGGGFFPEVLLEVC